MLPEGAPPFDRAKREFPSAAGLVREFLEVTSSVSNVEVRYWLARDKRCQYRIKNHTKCHIIDSGRNGTVIAGGSNVAPRPGNLDTDFIVKGEISGMYTQHFNDMWRAMDPFAGTHAPVEEGKREDDEAPLACYYEHPNEKSTSSMSKILFLPSQPSSAGEDVILRCVLGGIKQARKSVIMCMGHCNIPLSVARAMKDATERGVQVSVLMNSFYSCDLRGGQRDLFTSLRQMLDIAPNVELFVTAMKNGTRPPFLHSKYIVVDSEWSAVGSWNLWTRAAFYEMEGELFVRSSVFASSLRDKFEAEKEEFSVHVETPSDCMQFLPKGCALCEGFGPFY